MTDHFSLHLESGNRAFGQGDFASSRDSYLLAHQTHPDDGVLNANLAATHFELGEFTEAESFAIRAIELKPNYNRPRITLGMLYLMRGDFERGWREYEWTGSLDEKFGRLPPEREWKGQDLAGRSIVVIDEQGYGDTIQFLRFVPRLHQMSACVSLDVKPALRPLLEQNPRYGDTLHPGQPAEFVHWVRLLSIPRITRITGEELAPEIPYLEAPPLKRESRIHSTPGKRVGLIWRGSESNARNEIRSLSIHDLVFLFSNAPPDQNITFFHLHNLSFDEELTAAGLDADLIELNNEIDDFGDLAAAIDAMDLIITIDTAVAHLAGALGKPTWCLLSHVADWRWGQSGSQSDWYPHTRLFRQPRPGDWETPIREVVEQLT